MAIDVWMPMAIAAGVAAALLYPKRGALPVGVIVAVPPLLLCLYVVTSADPSNDTVQAVLVSVAWLVAAGLAALCTSFWLRRSKQNA